MLLQLSDCVSTDLSVAERRGLLDTSNPHYNEKSVPAGYNLI